jgi:hypothetical protein
MVYLKFSDVVSLNNHGFAFNLNLWLIYLFIFLLFERKHDPGK